MTVPPGPAWARSAITALPAGMPGRPDGGISSMPGWKRKAMPSAYPPGRRLRPPAKHCRARPAGRMFIAMSTQRILAIAAAVILLAAAVIAAVTLGGGSKSSSSGSPSEQAHGTIAVVKVCHGRKCHLLAKFDGVSLRQVRSARQATVACVTRNGTAQPKVIIRQPTAKTILPIGSKESGKASKCTITVGKAAWKAQVA